MNEFFERFEYFYWTGEYYLSIYDIPIVQRHLDLRIADSQEQIARLKNILYLENPPYLSQMAIDIGADIEHYLDLIELCRSRKSKLWKLNTRAECF